MELTLPVGGGQCSFYRSTGENVGRESEDHLSLQLELKLSWSNELDVNAVPQKSDHDGEASRSSSTNHALTDAEAEKGSSKCSEDDKEGGGGATKTRQKKLRLSKEQSCYLEDSFEEHTTLSPKQKNAIAKQLNLRPRQVEVWFQNRRARTKLKQTELDYERLKQRCENLTTENQRLRRELQELRALRAPTHRANGPPTALCVCPSCEKATPTTGDDGKRLGGYLGFPIKLKRQLC